jgi:hypothetical protein
VFLRRMQGSTGAEGSGVGVAELFRYYAPALHTGTAFGTGGGPHTVMSAPTVARLAHATLQLLALEQRAEAIRVQFALTFGTAGLARVFLEACGQRGAGAGALTDAQLSAACLLPSHVHALVLECCAGMSLSSAQLLLLARRYDTLLYV